MPEIGHTLDEIIMDFFTGCALANDEGLTSQIAETNFHVIGMSMTQRQDREDALRPEVLTLTIRPTREPGQECDVELMLPHGCDVFGRITLNEAQLHRFVTLPECLEEVRQKA